MVSQHALEKTIYDLVRDRPCTRIHGRPTYQHFCTLLRECQEAAFEINVGYAWCADLGLSPLIVGAASHLRDTGKTFTEPIQPPNVDARIIAGVTVTERAQYTAKNEELKEWRFFLIHKYVCVGRSSRYYTGSLCILYGFFAAL